MTVKIKVKDKLEDDTLDLSYCDLHEVPIREIATVKKASCLDLSNNQLTSLPNSIVTLTNIVKLDLSKNLLYEIPENIGEMRQLRHLGLCRNKISRLPLSLGELKNLKWLDLKDNPLTPAVASVAGPCNSNLDCQTCAKKIVSYLSYIKENIEEEKKRRLALITANDADKSAKKTEGKKKKKNKTNEKDNKQGKNEISIKSKVINDNKKPLTDKKNVSNNSKMNSNGKDKNNQCLSNFFAILFSLLISLLFIALLLFIIFIYLPEFDQKISNNIIKYLENQTNLPVKYFQDVGIEKKNLFTQFTIKSFKHLKLIVTNYYTKIIGSF